MHPGWGHQFYHICNHAHACLSFKLMVMWQDVIGLVVTGYLFLLEVKIQKFVSHRPSWQMLEKCGGDSASILGEVRRSLRAKQGRNFSSFSSHGCQQSNHPYASPQFLDLLGSNLVCGGASDLSVRSRETRKKRERKNLWFLSFSPEGWWWFIILLLFGCWNFNSYPLVVLIFLCLFGCIQSIIMEGWWQLVLGIVCHWP